MSCGADYRSGLDLAWLWLWCRSAAIAPIQPLGGEPPYAADAALKRPPPEKNNPPKNKT